MLEVKHNPKTDRSSIKPISQNENEGAFSKKLDRLWLLDYIRKYAPITIYEISKKTGFAYNTIKFAVREFQFSGLVDYRVVIGENNRTHKLIIIRKQEEKKND